MRLCAGDLGPVDVCARASPGLTRSTGPTASRPVTMRRRHRFTRDLLSRGRPLVPFFGSPAVRIDSLTRGFASPPRGGFALLVKGASYQNNTGARRSPIASQARHRKDDGSAPGPLADASGVARMTKRRRASDTCPSTRPIGRCAIASSGRRARGAPLLSVGEAEYPDQTREADSAR